MTVILKADGKQWMWTGNISLYFTISTRLVYVFVLPTCCIILAMATCLTAFCPRI